jgi:hypothetical protein
MGTISSVSSSGATDVSLSQSTSVSSIFSTSDQCFACHNGLVAPSGEDVSIASDWSASMMANSSRDPYWQAAVRREVMDFPAARADIEDECSICHMPMTTFAARAGGRKGHVLDRLPIGNPADPDAPFAADGVSCTVCHQLAPIRLGDPSTFTGGYVIEIGGPTDRRRIYGPFTVDEGRAQLMRSAAQFTPTAGTHIQQSEVCASCHMLFTHSLDPGAPATSLPEQAPYLEWQRSAFAGTSSCQTCHMPPLPQDMPISAVVGQPRPGYSRHTFRGGNFFMLRMLNRFRDELGVVAPAREMEKAAQRTIDHLQTDTARVRLISAVRTGGRIDIAVGVENLAGHKFPTGYPSRRSWLQVTATDSTGRVVFESGAFQPDGRVAGNDNDANPAAFEPHYVRIDRPDQVQVYESIMVGTAGAPTTGLLTGVRYAKDNRLLPAGFAKSGAPATIAVHGDAAADADFTAGGDVVRYSIDASGASGPLTVDVRLWFQPIGFRWAENLRAYKATEPERFMRFWDAMSAVSAIVIADTRVILQ